MGNSREDNKGLNLENLDGGSSLLLDADNAFWALTRGGGSEGTLVSREVISLYEKVKAGCDQEMADFRFSANLSAVYIDPTDRCNANCPYCYVPAKIRREGRSMTEGELKFVLSKIADHFKDSKRRPVVIFHASEPLLVKDILFKSIKAFKDRFYFGIQTNGLLLEKEDAVFLRDQNIAIGISLDSPDAATNNKARPSSGGGNFRKAIQAIEWLRGYKGLNVITTITKYNVTSLPALVRYLHGKGVRCVLINPVRLTQKNSRHLKPDGMVMADYFIKAVKEVMRLSKNSRRKIIIGNFANILTAIIAPSARRLMCDISPCGGGRCFFTITAKGDMIPCGEFIGLNGFSGGNIFKDSIGGAMRSAAFNRIRARFVEKVRECDTCIYRNICGSPCPAELHGMGDMFQKAVFCEFYKKVIRYAFEVIANGEERHALRQDGFSNLEFMYRL